MRAYFLLLVSMVALAAPPVPAPSVSAVLNGASYGASLSPGCWAVIYGSGLAGSTASAPSLPLPTSLGGVTVTVGGIPAPLVYVSASQINALIPFELTEPAALPVPTPVVVTSDSASSAAYNIPLTRNAPALFTLNAQGNGPALVFDAKFRPVSTVAAGQTVILYATGLGPVSGGSSGTVVDRFDLYAGDQLVEPSSVLFAGLAPGFPGIYQLNVRLPALLTDRLFIRQKGWQSNIARLGILPGENTLNATGSITAIYPPGNPNVPPYKIPPIPGPLNTSVVLEAAAFQVSFTISSTAQPFTVAAVGEAGATIVTINPFAGTYQTSSTVPTAATRAGDFGQADFGPIIDFAACSAGAACSSFPGSVIPLGRLDPAAVSAAQALSFPNVAVTPGSSTGLFVSNAGARSGSTFTLDDQTNSGVARFGGWLHLPYGPFATHTGTLELFVDGKLIASTTTSYPLRHR